VAGSNLRYEKLIKRNKSLYDVLDKVKLWVSRTGTLHGIRTITYHGEWIDITTHCGREIRVHDSKRGRGKRQLEYRYYKKVCRECKVPDWKIAKYTKRRDSGG
jgi:pyrrolysyl-tRNA synthetase-like protein